MCDPTGLLIYLSLLSILSIGIFYNNFFILYAGILLSSLVASFRADAGVDTFLYIKRFEEIDPGLIGLNQLNPIEPILTLLMWATKTLGLGFEFFSFLISMIVGIIYLRIFKFFPNARYFGLACFPVIYIDSIFNGVRIGLGYPLVFHAIVYSSLIVAILAFFTHLSTIVTLPLIVLIKRSFTKAIGLSFALIFLTSFVYYELIVNEFLIKFFQYQNIYTRNLYSGIADSSLLFVALISLAISRRILGKKLIFISLFILISIVIFHVLFISSYVFLLRVVRLLSIIIFAIIATSNQKINPMIIKICFFFGLLYSLNFLRQINDTCSYELNNGFLPLTPKISHSLFEVGL